MLYEIGMLCKHFKGHDLLEKNIYRIVELGVNGSDLSDDITYTGDGELSSASNLVVYANIFQDNKLFAREYEDISSELDDEKKEEYNQLYKVEPLRDEEVRIILSKAFIEAKKEVVAQKFRK